MAVEELMRTVQELNSKVTGDEGLELPTEAAMNPERSEATAELTRMYSIVKATAKNTEEIFKALTGQFVKDPRSQER